MKPDGTYSVEEILKICNEQLQSWERQELAEKLSKDFIISTIRNMSAEYLESITGYYVYEEEPEFDIDEELSTDELIDELEDRLSWQSIFTTDKRRIIEMTKKIRTFD